MTRTAVGAAASEPSDDTVRQELSLDAGLALSELSMARRQELERVAQRFDAQTEMLVRGIALGLGVDPRRVRGVDLKADPAVLLLGPETDDG
jgi:hypothetical protein